VFKKKIELEKHVRDKHRHDLKLMLSNGYLINQAFAADIWLSKKAAAM
jgi:hypothetical protein